MGFSNPIVPWADLERALSGKPPRPGAGAIRTTSFRPSEWQPAPDQPPAGPPPEARPHPDLLGPQSVHRQDFADRTPVRIDEDLLQTRVPYVELHAHSAFSFLDGASTPEQLVSEALRLGLNGLALTDHDGFYGVVRFAEAAAGTDLQTLYGSELSLDLPVPQRGVPDPVGEHLLVLARGQEGYRRLSRQISRAHLTGGEKGRPVYDLSALAEASGHWTVLTGCRKGRVRRALAAGGQEGAEKALRSLLELFGRERVLVELTSTLAATDDEDNDRLAELALQYGLPVVATTGAHYATPGAGRLGTAMAAVRARRSLDEADSHLPPGPGAHLRSGAEMAALFARYPAAVRTAFELGEQHAFDLTLVAPNLPPFDVPPGDDESTHLRSLTMAGAAERYGPRAENQEAYRQLEHELAIIAQLDFPGYFLIVHDIVQFCRRRGILCQGRGSAANSAVCYALGITHVDAVRYALLFERFLAPERDGPPDIDVDIESDRREEVIQYVYRRYGRDHAAQVANVNTFRPRMAVRDMARALGHSPGQQDAWSKQLDGWTPLAEQQLAGPEEHPIPPPVLDLATQLQDFPRHLSIHSGGMVICDRPIAEVCPVEWARMENRSVLQWDKDDCAAIGLVKFDLLGLGMLSALHYASELIAVRERIEIDFAHLDLEEPAVYEMLQRADSVGMFQVESRAQMATLPRLKPRRFYDLVVEVALVRPGPIQGGSVHPYIRRRNDEEEVTYDHPSMRNSLEKTLGIPLFQEQLMQLAIDVAGFDAGQADQLRRAMGSKRSTAKMEKLKVLLYQGMQRKNGITGEIADRVYERLLAFANFGFAESHALSFAALVFYSSWLKLHHPAAFCAALLRAQPMGFYSPQSLVADARRHGVTIRRPDVNASCATADLEPLQDPPRVGIPAPPRTPGVPLADSHGRNLPSCGGFAVRLGLDEVRGIGADLAARIVAARPPEGFSGIADLTRRVTVSAEQAESLATAGALDSVVSRHRPPTGPGTGSAHTAARPEAPLTPGEVRRHALWAAGAAAGERAGTLPGMVVGLQAPTLPGMSDLELTLADIAATGISPEKYPTEFSRARLDALGAYSATGVFGVEHGTRVMVAGMVTHRQRPATASGVVFINLEDETGLLNVICPQALWVRYRRVARTAPSLLVRGMVERSGGAGTSGTGTSGTGTSGTGTSGTELPSGGAVSVLADRIAAIDLLVAMPSRDFR